MNYNRRASPFSGRGAIVLLALLGLGYLFLQGKPGPSYVSSWRGNPFAEVAMGAALPGADGIVGEAAPLGSTESGPEVPYGNPLASRHTILTQGYGVGSHAPAAVWGAVDLALDSNGDGQEDPEGTLGMPIYATHRGVVRLQHDTWPAGNHIWVEGPHFKTGYSHLKDFAVSEGQLVERGQILGTVGATGEASGPHLDYQVWQDGVNVNPLGFGVLDGTN